MSNCKLRGQAWKNLSGNMCAELKEAAAERGGS